MLTVVCGLIGSGKTTYANQHYKNVTDLDDMPEYSRKSDQIALTNRLLNRGKDVCHITCYPTDEEFKAFKPLNPRYIWIDTSPQQAKTNILIRNRKRDIDNLVNVLKANDEYHRTPKGDGFKVIQVFRRAK